MYKFKSEKKLSKVLFFTSLVFSHILNTKEIFKWVEQACYL